MMNQIKGEHYDDAIKFLLSQQCTYSSLKYFSSLSSLCSFGLSFGVNENFFLISKLTLVPSCGDLLSFC